jgi:hypothetical protein
VVGIPSNVELEKSFIKRVFGDNFFVTVFLVKMIKIKVDSK